MENASVMSKLKYGFQSPFWVANILELFERFAFYGSKAILVVYLAIKVDLGTQTAGTLVGLYGGLIFSLPIVAGTFVDRYGFKKTLTACFAIFCIGYFLIGLAGLEFGSQIVTTLGKTTYIIIVLLLTAIGGSLIKPCIVGTVAKTTTPSTKSLGYSIYYTMVNIGGAVGPILALQVRENLGIEYVLIMSSITSFLLLIGTLIFFNEPIDSVETKELRSLKQVFADMLLVFRNLRFILFLIIFSGFWIMFWQIFYSLPFYILEVLKYSKFEVIESVGAWTIIFVTIPIAFFVKKMKPLTAIMIGFFLASSSWLILSAFNTIISAIITVGVFAIGEATQAPRYYEYVASLAPKEQVGTFMGFAFLPVALGAFIAGPLGGFLVENLLQKSYQPTLMWLIVSCIGFLSIILMLTYNLFLNKKMSN